ESDRIGRIGVNGTWKSSLSGVIACIDSADGDRQAVFYPHEASIGFLTQEPALPKENTVLEAVFQGENKKVQLVKHYEKILLELQADPLNEALQLKYQKLEEKMNEQDAWQTDTDARIILQKLGILDLKQKVK